MANTYTQIHIQTVFTVRNRYCLIDREWKERLFRYMTGIVQKNGHKMLQINGMPDHVHILIGLRPTQSLSDLMQKVKGASSEWVNKNGLSIQRFSWQEGYGAFSYRKSEVPQIIQYIQNQEEHHRKKSFIEEYEELLKVFEVEYDQRYIFEPVL